MLSYKKDLIAMLDKFVKALKEQSETIDLGCGCGSYEYVAVDDIDFIYIETKKEYEQQ